VRALLHRHLRDAGQWPAVVDERAQIADDEDVRITGNRERRLGGDAASAIERYAQRLRER
jgi:hypothetical protein